MDVQDHLESITLAGPRPAQQPLPDVKEAGKEHEEEENSKLHCRQ